MADDSLKLIPAAAVSSARLSSLLNEAYADYFLPVWLDEPRVVRMCQEVDVTLAHSVLAVAGDELVGVALLSQRGDRGWISGVGVVPSFRRQDCPQNGGLFSSRRGSGLRVVPSRCWRRTLPAWRCTIAVLPAGTASIWRCCRSQSLESPWSRRVSGARTPVSSWPAGFFPRRGPLLASANRRL